MITDVFSIDEKAVAHLREQWNDLSTQYNADEGLKAKSFGMLRAHYSREGRFYHNLSHIKALLHLFESVKHLIEDTNAIRFGIWFHDVIYDTKRTDNEEASADVAADLLSELSVDTKTIDFVRQLILATKSHRDKALTEDAKMFLDIDLSILGASSEIYEEYSKAIRKEYSWVPGFMYRSARKKILKGFMKREAIFATAEMNKRFEAQARLNVADELRAL
jgi:predicted metal-dependent HD superfamily phosphohydrolase